ncbi:recombinase RecT [Streptomyces sp. 2P-4]|uniref:recombinase RecT n=1 Tax=Streptomyces sp. 2P-4 TaxID=2931974 RepID=UPI002541D3C9|nr:recombinase RecT [Streptomyces sp. 2P-4]
MALNTLKDRVRMATAEKPVKAAAVPAVVVEGATGEELRAAEQAEGGKATDTVMAWLERYGDDFTAALPAHVDTGSFMAAVRAALPALSRCTPASLLQALLTCARFGLLPDGKHAVVKAEGATAVFIPMYQGYVELMYRSGRVGSVHVGLIHEHDEWSFEPTAPAPLDFTHKPRVDLPKAERGPVILAYAFAWMTSGARSAVVMLSREDAEAIRDEYSQAYRRAEDSGRADSFWHRDFNAMWSKSALRRLHKLVPMSAELVALARVDDAGDAGQVQVIHAPTGDGAELLAEADEAHERAEDSQAPEDARERPVSRTRRQPKRQSRAERRGARR